MNPLFFRLIFHVFCPYDLFSDLLLSLQFADLVAVAQSWPCDSEVALKKDRKNLQLSPSILLGTIYNNEA